MITERLRVVYTHDGDTLTCWRIVNGVALEAKVRLAFIDAPELAQSPYGISARAYFRSLLYVNEPVEARIYGTDAYGRLIAEIIRLRDYGNCGLRLVINGNAAVYRCPSDRTEYASAEGIARYKKAGIWRQPGLHQTPWHYRANSP
jgi:endonuclease YncB( thermonuclease family)